MDTPFFKRLDKIDKIISKGPKRCDFISDVQPLLLEDASKKYFYDSISDIDWLDVLDKAGEFRNPPEPIEDPEKNTTGFPLWPQSRLLIRMAADFPEKVLNIVLNIPDTKNDRVQEDIVDIAILLSPEDATKLVPLIKPWLKSAFLGLLHYKFGSLLSHLAKSGQIEIALELAEVILEVDLDDTSSEIKSDDTKFQFPPKPKPKIDIWRYEKILKENIPDLTNLAPKRTLNMLCNLLKETVQYSEPDVGERGGVDYSYIWRPAIEENSQNKVPGVRSLLISAVRDAAESAMVAEGENILETIESINLRIFKRLGLHLRAEYPEIDREGTSRLIVDPAYFNDVYIEHEYYRLLTKSFSNFSSTTQQAYLQLVENEIETKFWIANQEERLGKKPKKEDLDLFLKRSQYRKLWPIRNCLNKQWKSKYDAFKDEFGDLKHPDFRSYSGAVWVGPTSPKDKEELDSMDVQEIIKFLTSWKPPKDSRGSSPEGLGRQLEAAIAASPNRFETNALKFKELDPTYVRSLLSGFREALKQKRSYNWDQILDLCKWVVEKPKEIPGRSIETKDWEAFEYDPDWGYSRRVIADLLSEAFQSEVGVLPFENRESVWTILKPLTDDPDSGYNQDAHDNGSEIDPASVSINTIRGEAMHALIRYALWVRRNLENEPNGKKRVELGFDEMPEVRSVLDFHLDPNVEPSPAIRSIYGRWLPWIHLIDKDWTVSSKGRIFPKDSSLEILYDAAWETYITYCHPYDDIFDLLLEEYRRAVNRLSEKKSTKKSRISDPDKSLVEHLMTYYWRNKVDLAKPEGLMSEFFTKASIELRKSAFEFIGRSLVNTKEPLPDAIKDRLRSLLESRTAMAKILEPSKMKDELIDFGYWFFSKKFDDEWAIKSLKNVMAITQNIEPEYKVVNRLAELSKIHPMETLECLLIIVNNLKQVWDIEGWKEDARIILSNGLKNEKHHVHDMAFNLMNKIGSLGYIDFRDLLN